MSDLVPIRDLSSAGLPALHGRSTSLDLQTREGQLLAYRAATGRDATLDEMVGQTIQVQDYFAHWVPDNSEQAPPDAWRRRIVLIGPDGSLVSTGSEIAWRCVVAAASIACAQPPFDPPLTFNVHHKPRADKKGHWLYLEWLI